ncbi:MAG: winged helix-turn-helix transcriptional regulator [Phycisphaeraceae bacterium]|nr:winged helix-turn-helix transcriptional regulator [Phycisphaeraceae bacterium]
MARAATTTDVFNAIAEARRREIIEFLLKLSGNAAAVGDLVRGLRLPQPTVSKHLAVLRRVGLVSVRAEGRTRIYRLEADGLRHVHQWVKTFERYWDDQLDSIQEAAERMTHQRGRDHSNIRLGQPIP